MSMPAVAFHAYLARLEARQLQRKNSQAREEWNARIAEMKSRGM